jgi:selenophosphate synthase
MRSIAAGSTGVSLRNWASYGRDVILPESLLEWQRHLLTDPQTSGGLLVSCASDRAEATVQTIKSASGLNLTLGTRGRCAARRNRWV